MHYIIIVYIIISICHSLSNKLPSKLLSIDNINSSNLHLVIPIKADYPSNNNNVDDYTHYFESFHYKLDIDEYDDINLINIDENNILTMTTYANDTIYKIDLSEALTSHSTMSLNYDIASDWDEIYENGDHNQDFNLAIRRRLGWYNHVRHRGRYVADSITRRFKDAQNNCRHLYGDLASIMSKEEEEQVKDLCAMINLGNCYIGYKKPWGHWEDGRRPTYLHWKPGEPNNYGGNEGCAEIHTSGQWNDIKCTLSRIGICERARIHVVGHYIAVMRSLNWADANKRCQELFSTDLATIENARENIMVRRACSALNADADCWVGLRRPFRTWQDGEDAKVHNWADGEPNNAGGNEDCTAIADSQRWKDEKCDKGKYFVCNTITHDTRIKKRAEQKRRQQEKEAELEKKRKKMEDEIINQYMQQNQGNMMNQMMSGGSLYGGASGIGSPGGQMMAFANGGQPSMHQMFQMGSKEGQAAGLFNQMMTRQTGSMGGIGQHQGGQSMHQRPNYQYNHGGLDSGMSVGNMHPQQLESIYGNLGPLGSGNGMGQYTPGKPLRVQLVGRRRLQLLDVIHEHETGHDIDDIYGKKCKTLNDDGKHEICIGHNYINIRKYMDRLNKNMDERMLKRFEPISIDTQTNVEEKDDFNINPDTNYMGYRNWKYDVMNKTSNYRNVKIINGIQKGFDNFVNYFLNQQFIFDHLNGDNNQCFGYHDNFNLCMNMMDNDNNMRMMINDDKDNAFHFNNDNHWDEIERINGKSSGDNNKITSKCNYVYSGDMATKVCMQQTHNGDHGLSLYKSSVQFLATSGHRDNFPQFQF